MPKPKTPRQTLKIRRLPKVGDEITIKARVKRIGKNRYGTGDALTVTVPGYDYPITVGAQYLLGWDEE